MSSARATVAIIGGSGFYEIAGVSGARKVEMDTPYGRPSDAIVVGRVGETEVAFLARHGAGHRIAPSELPSQANIWALASLGVRQVLSVSAVGSLQEGIAPLDMVVPDQLIDRTYRRDPSFFGRGIVAHIAFDTPFCPALSQALAAAAEREGARVHRGGTLVVVEGPGFSTQAESESYRALGASIIGMTASPEAKLAREASMCYATLACVTDYDTWHASEERVSVELILSNLQKNVASARRIVADVAARPPPRDRCACARALRDAIVTPLSMVPEERKRELGPVLERHFEAQA
ncbi:MAG TPA: S-methyl-5'-thioadenosine phosphorylase [Dehalococcoidia bacterium]|nr:S-methyl-5'-thioadenosine phosphorylase [Dehalococcoidia bacterium]